MKKQDYEQLTLFREVSPASLFPWLESKKQKGTIVTSGRRCSELSENLSRVGYLVRTYLESSDLPPGMWSRVWSVKDLTPSCLILKLRLSERRTDERGYAFLPTPTATLANHGGPNQRDSSGRPGLQMAAMLWPTPKASDSMMGMTARTKGRPIEKSTHLQTRVWCAERGLWPTPAARDYKGSNSMEHLTRDSNNRNHVDQLANAVKLFPTPVAGDATGTTGGNMCSSLRTFTKMFPTPRAQSFTGASQAPNRQGSADLQTVVASPGNGQLNPTWVEWLMGFPIGWTELSASETP